MTSNITFSKTIKSLFTIFVVTTFLAACSTSSTKDENAGASSTTGTQNSSAASSGSQSGSVGTGTLAAPTGSVFYFDFDSSSLRAESRALLDAHVAYLKANPRAVRLEGHADERGTREYNIALGERRAEAVRAYLLSQGVTGAIEVVSYGEEKPAVTASNAYAWQQNRRVEIK